MVKSVAVIKILLAFYQLLSGYYQDFIIIHYIYLYIYIYFILYIHIYIYKVAYFKRPLTFSAVFLKIVWEIFSAAATTALFILLGKCESYLAKNLVRRLDGRKTPFAWIKFDITWNITISISYVNKFYIFLMASFSTGYSNL